MAIGRRGESRKNSKTNKKEGRSSQKREHKPTLGKKRVSNKPIFNINKRGLPKFDGTVRLNKFLSNAGICSRREADMLIATGVISVNGKIVTEMGYKVLPTDKVQYDGETIRRGKKYYILVNKPKNYSIRLREEGGKAKSVYQFIKSASEELLIPIGRLRTNDAGLIIYTNDSDLELKLSHGNTKVSQLFHLVLNKEFMQEDLNALKTGVFVDNILFRVEDASYIDGRPKNEIGVRLFSSKSNTAKLLMGKLDYEIIESDRVEYAGLTKKDLSRGRYRHLSNKELGFLMMA